MSELNSKTFILFRMPNFITGFGKAIDIAGNPDEYNYSSTEQEADSQALAADWEMIGSDIRNAIVNFENFLIEEKK